jgi:DNA polymerase (family 10)
MRIPGVGPRTAALLATELHISSIDELADALRSGAVAGLPGLGEKTTRTLLEETEAYRRRNT